MYYFLAGKLARGQLTFFKEHKEYNADRIYKKETFILIRKKLIIIAKKSMKTFMHFKIK